MPEEKIIPEYSWSLSTWNKVYCNFGIKASFNEIRHAEKKGNIYVGIKARAFEGGNHVSARRKRKDLFLRWLKHF